MNKMTEAKKREVEAFELMIAQVRFARGLPTYEQECPCGCKGDYSRHSENSRTGR